jgi:pimeloyl-ACP methyl ester carboxylesterase
VICVHGLTRNSHDFDALAAELSPACRVVCPDVVGRGASDWLEHKNDYGFALYQSDAAALIARLSVASSAGGFLSALRGHSLEEDRPLQVDWVGTSMGGLIGMMLAARSGSPIRRLVLNDVGPLVPWRALRRLHLEHSNENPQFADLDEAESYMRQACVNFGPLSDGQWRDVTRHSVVLQPTGMFRLGWDPAIIGAVPEQGLEGVTLRMNFLSGIDMWPIWNKVRCPVLVLRGADSDLLTSATVARMQASRPQVKVVEFPGVGHAPWLMSAEQIAVVRDFLLAADIAP